MELLVVARDRPVEDSPGKWKRGDVVAVKPDGYEWAREEKNPEKFTIIKIRGTEARHEVEDLLEEENEMDPLFGTEVLRNRRTKRLTEALVQKAERQETIRIADVKNAKEVRPRPALVATR